MTQVRGSGRSLVSAGAYALAAAAQRALAFLLLPLYTAVLTPAEYGRLSLLLSIFAAASVTLAAGFEFAVTRGFIRLEHDRAAQRRFVVSAWTFLMVAAPVAAAVVSLPLLAFAENEAVFQPDEVLLVLMAAAMFVAATIVPLAVLRAEQRLRDYLILSAVAGIASASLTVTFVVICRWGVTGWLGAMLLANALVLIVAMRQLPWGRPSPFDRAGVRAALALGVPLIPHALSLWSLQLADRLVLSTIVSAASLGVYSLGANLALPCMIIVQSLNQGFMPTYARTWKDEAARRELTNVITMQVGIVLMAGAATALLGPPLAGIVAPPSYAGAAELIPWLALGYTFLGLYFIPMNGVTLIVGRTNLVWIMTATSAALGLCLIAVLVPRFGLETAAISVATAYGMLFVSFSLYARSLHMGIPVDRARVLRLIAVLSAGYTVIALVTPNAGWTGLAIRLVAFAGLGALGARVAGIPVERIMSRRT